MSDDPSPTGPVTITTSDGVRLEAEVSSPGPDEPTQAMVICHPHPLYGGTMEANVVAALFGSVPAPGRAALRFNFRGAGRSEGRHDEGRGERLDVEAALLSAADRWPRSTVFLAGYSFGADVSLSVDGGALVGDRFGGWLAVAPPLRIVDRADLVALGDERPKVVVGAGHDQFNPYRDLAPALADVPNTTVIEAPGADHFFAVGLDRVVEGAQLLLSPPGA